MLEFLGALQKQLSTTCRGFAEWLESVKHSIVTPHEAVQNSYSDQVNKSIKIILLAVQWVMNRHRGSEMGKALYWLFKPRIVDQCDHLKTGCTVSVLSSNIHWRLTTSLPCFEKLINPVKLVAFALVHSAFVALCLYYNSLVTMEDYRIVLGNISECALLINVIFSWSDPKLISCHPQRVAKLLYVLGR